MYFSGFCFENEKELFKEYLVENNFTVSGFSYGAIQALDKAYEMIQDGKRVDLIQLFSPAFFEDKDEKFKRLQMMFFQKDPKAYCDNFIDNTIYPNKILRDKVLSFFKLGSKEQLHDLLYHKWNLDKIETLKQLNINIEIYLGAEDKIIDPNKAKEFFIEYAEVYFIKNVGHILN